MKLRFRGGQDRFYDDLRSRVNQYFKSKNLSRKGNAAMYSKTVILGAMYFVPYILILTLPLPLWAMWLLTVEMGIALAGLGMSVMHDACHGAYSKRKRVNDIMSYSMNVIGGNKFNWMIQHNVKHHTYTNIHGADEDLENGGVIRLSPFSEWSWYHRFQHIYSWFLYLLGTLSWVTIKDFRQFGSLYEEIKDNKQYSFGSEVFKMIFSKILYYGYIVVIPLLVLTIPWYYIAIGFVTMHFVAGFILSVTFQLAHVVEDIHHEEGEGKQMVDEHWAVFQMMTTSNFARRNRVLSWYMGGLNYQVEHHLFTNICHVHYRKLAEIVRATAQDHGVPYNEHRRFFSAVRSHYNTLKEYSLKPAMAS